MNTTLPTNADLQTALQLIEHDYQLSVDELADTDAALIADPARRLLRADRLRKRLEAGKPLRDSDVTFLQELVTGEMDSLGFKLMHDPDSWSDDAGRAVAVAALAETLKPFAREVSGKEEL